MRGNIPVLTVCERSLAEAYEKALIALYEHGIAFRTQYDKPGDPPSLDCYDPPCLQSIWYRIVEDDQGVAWLNCNIRFRGNDAWGANFMNMFGFTLFNRDVIAAAVARRRQKELRLGRMNWQADSYHIYGKDIAGARQRLFDRLPTTRFEDRVHNFNDPDIREIYQEADTAIREKIRNYDAEHGKAGADSR